jgi:AmiR/NasT family two-component response regulator
MKGKQKPRVLIAEDDYLVSEAIKRALNQIGYELIGNASDGLEAVEMACALKPDVVLMDIKMPELDGLEAAKRIMECCPMPIVVLSAHESKDLIEKASETGVAAYLTKPPKSNAIERAIIIAMARHNDLMELRRLNTELQFHKEELEKALAEIKTLRGILPICSHCKKIRDDKGYWNQIESYIRDHSEAEFSHSVCPDCLKKHYPKYFEKYEG